MTPFEWSVLSLAVFTVIVVIAIFIYFMSKPLQRQPERASIHSSEDVDAILSTARQPIKKQEKTVIDESEKNIDKAFIVTQEYRRDVSGIKPPWFRPFARWTFAKKTALRNNPGANVMIRMKLNNENVDEFVIPYSEFGFILPRGEDKVKFRYLFDDKVKYFNIPARLWCYDFEESFCLPIKRTHPFPTELTEIVHQLNDYQDKFEQLKRRPIKSTFDINAIKKAIDENPAIETASAVNPDALQRYLESDFIKNLVSSRAFINVVRVVLYIVIGILALLFIDLLVLLWHAGAFEKIRAMVHK